MIMISGDAEMKELIGCLSHRIDCAGFMQFSLDDKRFVSPSDYKRSACCHHYGRHDPLSLESQVSFISTTHIMAPPSLISLASRVATDPSAGNKFKFGSSLYRNNCLVKIFVKPASCVCVGQTSRFATPNYAWYEATTMD